MTSAKLQHQGAAADQGVTGEILCNGNYKSSCAGSSASHSVCEFEKSSEQSSSESKFEIVDGGVGVAGKKLPLPPLVPGK